jgi:hypothetical protein
LARIQCLEQRLEGSFTLGEEPDLGCAAPKMPIPAG